MRIHRISYGVRGFVKLADYALRWAYMITEKAQTRARALKLWHSHGMEAAKAAFQVQERTLYDWQAKLKAHHGKLEALNDKSKRPKNVRVREWSDSIKREIKRLRDEHPNLGKDKIWIFLQPFCKEHNLKCPSVSTVGNLIKDMGGLRKFPIKVRHNGTIVPRKRAKVLRKPKHFVADHIGHCGSFDTIERNIHGSKRYILTFPNRRAAETTSWFSRMS